MVVVLSLHSSPTSQIQSTRSRRCCNDSVGQARRAWVRSRWSADWRCAVAGGHGPSGTWTRACTADYALPWPACGSARRWRRRRPREKAHQVRAAGCGTGSSGVHGCGTVGIGAWGEWRGAGLAPQPAAAGEPVVGFRPSPIASAQAARTVMPKAAAACSGDNGSGADEPAPAACGGIAHNKRARS